MTRVSVVLPVRNGAAHLREAVDSILSQTMTAFELIVIDDGSTDATPALLAGLSDPRVRVLRQDGLGLVAALNRGLMEARGPYVARMDADDIARPGRLAAQAARLDAAPGVALVGGAYRVIAADGTPMDTVHPPTGAEAVQAGLLARNVIAHPTVMLRRDAVLAAGLYRPAFDRAEDYDLWLRLSERHQLENLTEIVLDYRQHPGQSGWVALEQRILSEMGAIAAAKRRAGSVEDGMDGPEPIDRAALGRLGLSGDAISDGVIGRALGAAADARRAGFSEAARVAYQLVLRQPSLRWRTRAHAQLRLRFPGR